MVLLDIKAEPQSTKIFEACLWTIDGCSKIVKYKYQPVLNIKHIRQGCRILYHDDLNLDQIQQENIFRNILDDDTIDLNNVAERLEKIKLSINPPREKKYSLPCYNHAESFVISSTKQTSVLFEFMFNSEYLTEGSHIIINDQSLKAYGVIRKCLK